MAPIGQGRARRTPPPSRVEQALGPKGRQLSDEVGERNFECVSDEEQVVDARCVRALLDAVDGLAVQSGELAESLLCEFLACAFGSDRASDGLSAGGYPVGQRVGWHAYTLVGAVIIVCTTVGTFEGSRSGQFETPNRIKHTFE